MIKMDNYGIDFSIDDIDNLIEVLEDIKNYYQNPDNDDKWYDIIKMPDSNVIIQGSDRDNIWIEKIDNVMR